MKITRADFLTLLVRTLELDVEFESDFVDVRETDYYFEAVGIAKELGITTGIGNDKFGPNDYITRQDIMVMTANALKIKGLIPDEINNSVLDDYTDKFQISLYALDSVMAMVNEKLILGTNNMIYPKGNTTRAESAVLLYRLYNLQ